MANKEAIGFDLGEITIPVERGKIREFANALLADEAEYHDPDVAGGMVAPPTFTQVIAFWDAPSGADVPDLGMDFLRVMHGEQEFEYFAPIRAGDELTVSSRISDVFDRERSDGRTMAFVVFENTYTNQDGEKVAVSRMSLIEPPAPA